MKKRQGIKNLDTWWADREQDLLAEIARLRGALRTIGVELETQQWRAVTTISLTPEDMKE